MRFDTTYKIYIDLNYGTSSSSWVQVYPHIEPLVKSPFNEELFTRYKFGKFTFKNEPGNSAFIYNSIKNSNVDQEIRVKVDILSANSNPDSISVIGYFGVNDCEFDNDRKVLTVIPTVYDQYTDLVENWETEINVFEEQKQYKGKWTLSETYKSTYGSTPIEESHNLPLDKITADFDEAKSTPEVYVGSNPISDDLPPVIQSCLANYSATFNLSIGAVTNLTLGETAKIYLDIYDSSNTLSSHNLLGTIASTGESSTYDNYSLTPSLSQGDSVYLYVVLSNDGIDDILFNSLVFTATISSIPYSTTDINTKIQDDYRVDYPIWVGVDYGKSESTKTNDYDSDIPSLAAYFNANGSPKSTLLTENRYAPYSRKDSIFLITENGYETVTLKDLYLTDIESLLDGAGFELSRVKIYKHRWNRTFAKDRYITYCEAWFTRFEQWVVDGEDPIGDDWIDTTHTNAGKRLYVKKPFDGTITDWTLGSEGGGGVIGGSEYVANIESSKWNNYPDNDSSVVKPTRDLYDVIKQIYNDTHPSLAGYDVQSSFFWNDSDALIPVSSGINYVTGEFNWLNNIACLHTYQLKEIDEDSDDSILEISFKDLMQDLKTLFNDQIFWWIETDGTLRIEHVKYFDYPGTRSIIDLTSEASASDFTPYPIPYTKNSDLLSEISNWTYDKSKMFSNIEINCINSGYRDFTKNKISFDKIVSNKRNEDIKSIETTSILSTDIRYAVLNPTSLENGMILLNYDSNNVVIADSVPIANTVFENGNIALSNILDRYLYEGVFTTGKLNGKQKDFANTRRTKIGGEFVIKGIFNYDFFKNVIGVGMIESITHDLDKETTKIKLRYRYSSDTETDTFTLMVSQIGDYVGATNVEFDFG